MNEPAPKETQQDLFGDVSAPPKKADRFGQMARSQKTILVTTNAEQLILAGIFFILLFCGIFFLGVVRGKSLSGQPPAPSQATARPALLPERSSAPPSPVRTVSPARKAAAPAVPAAVASKPYTLQLVTHRKKDLATNEMNTLRGQGFYSFIIPSGEYFQVCVGQYASKEEAKQDQARFIGKYKDCFLRRK